MFLNLQNVGVKQYGILPTPDGYCYISYIYHNCDSDIANVIQKAWNFSIEYIYYIVNL